MAFTIRTKNRVGQVVLNWFAYTRRIFAVDFILPNLT
jgi:hypothetical protein